MLGGEPEEVRRAEAFLEPAAARFVHAGAVGSGLSLKICNNILTYITVLSIDDAVRLAQSAGLPVALLAEVVANNGVASPMMTSMLMARAGRPISDEFVRASSDDSTKIAQKDLDCALEVAVELGIDLPAVRMASREKARAMGGIPS